MKYTILIILLLSSQVYSAIPFFNQNGNNFDPQIDIIYSGTVLDVQTSISRDQKYITLNMRPQTSKLEALRSFTFQKGYNNYIGINSNKNTILDMTGIQKLN